MLAKNLPWSQMVENSFQDLFGYCFSYQRIDYRGWRLFSGDCSGTFCIFKMDII